MLGHIVVPVRVLTVTALGCRLGRGFLFLIVLGGRKSKTKVLADLVSGRAAS